MDVTSAPSSDVSVNEPKGQDEPEPDPTQPRIWVQGVAYVMRHFGQRLLWLVPTLLLVSFGVFLLLDRAPGDVAVNIAGEYAPQDVVEATRDRLGLDQPVLKRYGNWLSGAVRGDLGQSYETGQDVGAKIVKALPTSLSLLFMAFVIAISIGLILGVGPFLVSNRWVDKLATLIISLTASAQPVLVGVPLVSWLGLRLGLFPALGYVSPADGIGSWLHHLVLPGMALALIPAGEIARQLRSALQETMRSPFVLALEARGMSRPKVVLKHALRNAAIPSVTVLGVSIAQMLGATVLVEYLFMINGLGRLTVRGALVQDAPVVLGVAIVTGLVVSLINVIVDASYTFFNPKTLV